MTTKSQNLDTDTPSQHIRWWPAAAILILDFLAISWIWFPEGLTGQAKVMRIIPLQVLIVLLIVLWLLFFSRLRRKTRWISLAGFVISVIIFASLFRIGGVSGNLVPVFVWRWAGGLDETFETESQNRSNDPLLGSSYDYPQFLGPYRNAIYNRVKLSQNWSTNPPRVVWRQSIGEGWSSFAVVGNSAITQEQRGSKEMVVCYELKSGKVNWVHSDNERFETVIAGIGPRATPTISGNRVYTVGATGILNCLDLATGKRIWSKNILKDNNAKINEWGISCSPLVIDSLVIVSAGGPAMLLT